MTHILQKCPHCGAKNHDIVYGYVPDPIGIPFGRCPRCGQIVRTRGSAEWIQMEDFAKYRSIHPRGKYGAFFTAIPISVLLYMPLAFLMGNERNVGLLFLLAFGVGYCLAHWLHTTLRANSEKFLDRYCDSILRTRRPDYHALLERDSLLFGEDLPKWVPLTKGSRDYIAGRLAGNRTMDFEIPNLFDPRNSI